MVIGETEGIRFRFEVVESIDGFSVRRTHREAVDCGEEAEILFRTAQAAFAYAELAALQDRVDAGDPDELPGDTIATYRLVTARFARLRDDLGDHGVSGALLGAWMRAEARERQRQVH